MSISQHSHKFYQYEVLKDSPCTNNLWVSASSQLTSASKTSPLTLAAESKYTGRAPWEGGTSQLVCYSLHIWKRKWWLYASLHFSLLGQTNLMQVWIAVELLVPVPPQQLGPAGVEAAFSLAPAPWQRSLDYPWHCVTPAPQQQESLAMAVQLPSMIGAGQIAQGSWWWVHSYLPCTSSVLLCNQPKRKFPFNQPVILAALPQQSPVLLLGIEICHETLSSYKKLLQGIPPRSEFSGIYFVSREANCARKFPQSCFFLNHGAGFGQTSKNKAVFRGISAVASCSLLGVFLYGEAIALGEVMGSCE